jgi:hypothetical protein
MSPEKIKRSYLDVYAKCQIFFPDFNQMRNSTTDFRESPQN